MAEYDTMNADDLRGEMNAIDDEVSDAGGVDDDAFGDDEDDFVNGRGHDSDNEDPPAEKKADGESSGDEADPRPPARDAQLRARPQRDAEVFITGSCRRTSPVMSIFERARIIGERAAQIEQGASDIDPRVVEKIVASGVTQALDIAEEELEFLEADFPLNIHRRIDANVYEVWRVRELKLPSQVLCESYSPAATALLHERRKETTCPSDVSKSLARSFAKFELATKTR